MCSLSASPPHPPVRIPRGPLSSTLSAINQYPDKHSLTRNASPPLPKFIASPPLMPPALAPPPAAVVRRHRRFSPHASPLHSRRRHPTHRCRTPSSPLIPSLIPGFGTAELDLSLGASSLSSSSLVVPRGSTMGSSHPQARRHWIRAFPSTLPPSSSSPTPTS